MSSGPARVGPSPGARAVLMFLRQSGEGGGVPRGSGSHYAGNCLCTWERLHVHAEFVYVGQCRRRSFCLSTWKPFWWPHIATPFALPAATCDTAFYDSFFLSYYINVAIYHNHKRYDVLPCF